MSYHVYWWMTCVFCLTVLALTSWYTRYTHMLALHTLFSLFSLSPPPPPPCLFSHIFAHSLTGAGGGRGGGEGGGVGGGRSSPASPYQGEELSKLVPLSDVLWCRLFDVLQQEGEEAGGVGSGGDGRGSKSGCRSGGGRDSKRGERGGKGDGDGRDGRDGGEDEDTDRGAVFTWDLLQEWCGVRGLVPEFLFYERTGPGYVTKYDLQDLLL